MERQKQWFQHLNPVHPTASLLHEETSLVTKGSSVQKISSGQNLNTWAGRHWSQNMNQYTLLWTWCMKKIWLLQKVQQFKRHLVEKAWTHGETDTVIPVCEPAHPTANLVHEETNLVTKRSAAQKISSGQNLNTWTGRHWSQNMNQYTRLWTWLWTSTSHCKPGAWRNKSGYKRFRRYLLDKAWTHWQTDTNKDFAWSRSARAALFHDQR